MELPFLSGTDHFPAEKDPLPLPDGSGPFQNQEEIRPVRSRFLPDNLPHKFTGWLILDPLAHAELGGQITGQTGNGHLQPDRPFFFPVKARPGLQDSPENQEKKGDAQNQIKPGQVLAAGPFFAA